MAQLEVRTWPERPLVHDRERAARNPDLAIEWKDRDGYRACAWCGSMHFADLFELLDSGPQARVSGSDWKYGWPHKFYVHAPGLHAKVYTEHLLELDQPVFDYAAARLLQATGVEFFVEPADGWPAEVSQRRMKYRAPYHGYQRT